MDPNQIIGYICEDEDENITYHCKYCQAKLKNDIEFRTHAEMRNCCREMCDLPDLCMEAIFKYLAPSGLANMSLIYPQLKGIAARIFSLYCDPGPIEIHFFKTSTYFSSKLRYEQCFASLIRRVIINCHSYLCESDYEFIRRNCPKELISLDWYATEVYYPAAGVLKMHSEIIKNQLANLTNLRLVNAPIKNLYDDLLLYCGRLKSLQIICADISEMGDTWIDHLYPELESVSLYCPDDGIDFTRIIHNNQNLKSIACNSLLTIRSICRSSINFKCVAMTFDEYRNFFEVLNEITDFVGRKNFEQFELGFPSHLVCGNEVIQAAIGLPNLTALHCSLAAVKNLMRDRNLQLPLIQKLCLDSQSYDIHDVLEQMDKCFPNLRDIRFSTNAQETQGYSRIFARNIFRYFRNLKQMRFGEYENLMFTMNDVIQWDRSRSHLEDVSAVVVYLEPVVFHNFHENVVKTYLISVKPWLHGNCDICEGVQNWS